jgi:hypothetical protein
MGGCHPIVWGHDLNDGKIKNKYLVALGGRIRGNTQQPINSRRGSDGGESGDEAHVGLSVWEGVVLSFGATKFAIILLHTTHLIMILISLHHRHQCGGCGSGGSGTIICCCGEGQ